MTDQASLSPFATSAQTYLDLGYHPLPLIPPSVSHHAGRGKAPGEFTMGAWRGMPKWQGLRDAAPSAFQVGLWTSYPNANVGLVMGSPIGSDRLIAVDVDVTDFDRLRELLGALPHSPMAKRGSKGETRFYRAAPTVKSTSYDDEVAKARDKASGVPGGPYRLLDLLTGFDTRQTVCPPSAHPDGATYAWLSGPVAARDLPELTQDHLSELEETLAGMGWVPAAERSGARPKRDASAPMPDAEDYFSETKAAALANLEAWVYDLDVFDLRPARGGFEAVATWRPSSTGQPIASRKRNLSIQPNGIKDFGTNWTGSAIDLVMAAQNLDQAEATTWLRMRLGLVGDVIVLEQRAKAAPEISAVWINEVASIPPRTIEAVISAQPTPRALAPPSGELPDRLTRVPGLVGEITEWIVASAKRPQRGLALGAAVTLVGTAAGRKVSGPTDSGTHLYVLAIAATGAGKDHPLKCIGAILSGSAMNAHNGPSQFMSMSALINTLTSQPLTLSAMDEFGAFLKRVNGAKAGNHEQAISGIMRQVWGSSFGEIKTPAYAQVGSKTLTAPAFSLYGASTAEEFYAAVEGDDVLNGFLNRFLTISTRLRPPEQKPTASIFAIPEAITKGMVEIYNIGGPLLGATSHNGMASPPSVRLTWADAAAEAVYDRFGLVLEDREADMAFLSRTREMAIRLATIRAIGMGGFNPSIKVTDMEWGRDLALWSAERMMEDAGDYMSVNDHQAMANRILRVVKDRGRLKHSDLLLAMKNRLRARDLKDHVSGLVESGQILAEQIRPEAGGTAVVWYMAA